LETNVVFPGVLTLQVISPLLASVPFLVIAVLVLSAMIQQRSSMATRRVVLQRAEFPFHRESSRSHRSITLPQSLAARAPPTLPSDLTDTD
jgi:uncharacterized membrane protein YbaN (DUF454 family)